MGDACVVELSTSHGPIRIALHHADCPLACRNFVELCNGGYYNGCIIHRVVPGFMLQTGCPNGDGSGGASIYAGGVFGDEIKAKFSHDRRGVVSMANTGRDTNASQFFIALDACPHLDGKHTVFGLVRAEGSGHEALENIATVKLGKKNCRPAKDVQIFSAVCVADPWEGQPLPAGAKVPERDRGGGSGGGKCATQ